MKLRYTRIVLIALMVLILAAAPILAGNEDVEATGAEKYLLLIIDADTPAGRGWAEVIVGTLDLEKKELSVDSMDSCRYYFLPDGKLVQLGEIYSIGGEQLVMEVINRSHWMSIDKYAKITYDGVGAIAEIFGASIDTDQMLSAS
jgi:hypothetical protein